MKQWFERVLPMIRARGKYARAGLVAGLLLLFFTTVVQADTTSITFYACVNNSSGTIFMITATETCATNQQEIIWNNIGPQGPAGPQGPQGPTGPQGPSGVSTGYVAKFLPSFPFFLPSGVWADVVDMFVATGKSYVVNATVVVGGFPAAVQCGIGLEAPGVPLSPQPGAMLAQMTVINSNEAYTLAVNDSIVAPAGPVAGIALFCEATNGAPSVGNASITAIQLNSLNP